MMILGKKMDRKVRTVYLPMGIHTTCARRNYAVLAASNLAECAVYERKDAMFVFDTLTEARDMTTIEKPISLWMCEVFEDDLVKFVTTGGFVYYKTKCILHPRSVKGNIYKFSDPSGNVGRLNIGDKNVGTMNTGLRNEGAGNIGYSNRGTSNYGRYNTGTYNAGSCNDGNLNQGFMNCGRFNIGKLNNGSHNIGEKNVGTCNVGCNNVGHLNIGNCNVGCFNVTNYAIGFFNTKPCNEFRIFDKCVNGDDYSFGDIMEVLQDYANYIYAIGAEKLVKRDYSVHAQTKYPLTYNEDRTTHVLMTSFDKEASMDDVYLATDKTTFYCLIADLEAHLPYGTEELAEKLSKVITCKPMDQIKKEQKI